MRKQMKILLVAIFLFIGTAGLFAKEELRRLILTEKEIMEKDDLYAPKKVIKAVKNLNFEVEEDRPIVREGGLIKPMDFEQYINYKVDKLRERVEALEQKVENLR